MLHLRIHIRRRFDLNQSLQWLEGERIVLGSIARMNDVLALLNEDERALLDETISTAASHSFWHVRNHQLKGLGDRIMYLIATNRELDARAADCLV